MKSLIIICLLHTNAGGDNGNVLGIANALQQELNLSQQNVHILKSTETKIESLQAEVATAINQIIQYNKGSKFIVLGAGEEGYYSLLAVKRIKEASGQDLYTHWSGHQFSNFLKTEATSLLDSITLPNYAITQATKETFKNLNVKLEETIGIPHNVTEKDLENSYLLLKEKIHPANQYLFVVLAGDAQTPDKTMLFFTENEARKLAEYIAQVAKQNGQFILITNGPRTGKYNLSTHNLINSDPIDKVSKAFLNHLEQLLPNKSYQFFDFKLSKTNPRQNAYKALLHLIKITANSTAYIPGESISMLSECIDNLPTNKIIAYENGAMNNNHHNYIQQIYNEGINIVHYQNGNYIFEKSTRTLNTKTSISDTIKIAKFIILNINLDSKS